jgi:hypothetical protein
MNINPNYFESTDDGQTPSNTPSNKMKGGIQFDMNALNIDEKLKEKYDNEEDIIKPETEYCVDILLGKLQQGHYLNDSDKQKSCSKIFCTKCNSKVIFIPEYKMLKNNTFHEDVNHKIKECMEKNESYNTYCCKCTFKSITDECITANSIGIDFWECDGHIKHH